MDLNDIKAATSLTFSLMDEVGKPFIDKNGNVHEILITAYTPESKQWEAATRKHTKKREGLEMQVRDDGNVVKLPDDPEATERQKKIFAEVTTNITGISNWEFSPEAVMELYLSEGATYISRQFKKVMDGDTRFLVPSDSNVKRGSKA